MIHVVHGQTDQILAYIPEKEFWDDVHRKSLKDTLETFDFTTRGDRPYSEYLSKRNRLVIPDEDGRFVEFIIENTRKYRSTNGGLFIEVYSVASYLDLRRTKRIPPQVTSSWNPRQHAEWALSGTEWKVGDAVYAGMRSIVIESNTNPYSFLKTVASEFEIELNFRVETNGTKVIARYVDLVERIGEWHGREVVFGKDLAGIERKEDYSNLATALIGIGPERDDGTRLEVLVEDLDALARWGRNNQHIIDVYEPDSSDSQMTLDRLRTLTRNELNKRINSVVEYSAEIVDLEKVPGLENKKIRFGDTIKIKDTAFNPPLYIEARVHTQERSLSDGSKKKVELGDFIEYTEQEATAIWQKLQEEIKKKVSMSQVLEVTYTKQEVDNKDSAVLDQSTGYAEAVSEQKKQEAIAVADQKIQQAKTEIEANMEVKIARGSTAPISPKVNDIWIDTSTSPPVWKLWNGSTWQKMTRTQFTELAGKITGLQIETGTIEPQHIAWLDASLITAGTMVADRIRGGTLELGGYNNQNGSLVIRDSAGNERVRGNSDGLSVNEGHFLIKDKLTQVQSVITPVTNMVNDHSFEMIPRLGSADAHQTFSVDRSRMGNYFWWYATTVNARVLSTYNTDLPQLALFDKQAIVLRNSSYVLWKQYVELDRQVGLTGPYTISAWFAAFTATTVNTSAVIEIWACNDSFTRISRVGIAYVPIYYYEPFVWKRGSVTVSNLPSNTEYLEITLYCTPDAQILCDGVQMVPLSRPAVYNPESSVWRLMRGLDGYYFNSVMSDIIYADTIAGRVSTNVINLGLTGPSVDMNGGAARWKQSTTNYIRQATDGTVTIFVNDVARHIFHASGTKTGGSIEIEGKVWGMSPIDSPRVLIEDILFDVAVDGQTEVPLEERFSKAVSKYAVFPSSPDVRVLEKRKDSFVLHGKGVIDARVVGLRVGSEAVCWVDLEKESQDA